MPKLTDVLASPRIYDRFQNLVGARKARDRHFSTYLRPTAGIRLLDIGCGTGEVLEQLPEVDYFGLDVSPAYIEHAKKKYGHRGSFYCTTSEQFELPHPGTFDIAMANGVVHHLSDAEADALFKLAAKALKPGGRLVTLDGCFVPGQSWFARWMLRNDRGKFVRTQEEYLRLASQTFANCQHFIHHDLLNIPYTHIILVCTK